MSGSRVSQALQDRFDSIYRAELKRLDKKFRSLSDTDRQAVEALVSEVVIAIAQVPAQRLVDDLAGDTLEAVARLFDLTADSFAA